jgi:hypothetical protein
VFSVGSVVLGVVVVVSECTALNVLFGVLSVMGGGGKEVVEGCRVWWKMLVSGVVVLILVSFIEDLLKQVGVGVDVGCCSGEGGIVGLWLSLPLSEVGCCGESCWWVCWCGGVVTLGDVVLCAVIGFEGLLEQVEVVVDAVVGVVVAGGVADRGC